MKKLVKNKKQESEEQSLDSLIKQFYENNEKKKTYEKEADTFSKQIKTIMGDKQLKEYITDDIKATYSIQQTFGFDENILIPILKEKLSKEQLKDIVKLQEYVDFDALDSLLYNQKDKEVLDPTLLQKAQTIKSVIKLLVGKINNKKLNKN